MTKTITDEPTMSPTELQAEFAALSLRVSQGDTTAEKPLAAIEARMELITRTERRRQAAMTEERRLEAEAARQATLAAHAKAVAEHQVALEARDFAYGIVEKITDDLVAAIQRAILEGNEAHSSALRLGYSPGITAASRISTYIAWRLGRDGADNAGLSGMEPTFPQMRQPLVIPSPVTGN